MNLTNKSVLVTRPQPQAQGLVAKLSALGARPVAMPLLEITPYQRTSCHQQVALNLGHYDLIVVISTNAAHLGMALFDRYRVKLPPQLRWYAVGAATAKALWQYGITADTAAQPGETSEALLSLPELHQVVDKRVLILKGEGGRDLLRQTLRSRGAKVEELVLYRRVAVDYCPEQIKTLLGSAPPDFAVVTSGAILQGMHRLLLPCYPDLISVNLIVASERIAGMARDIGYQTIIVAQGASDHALIDAMTLS